MQISESIFDSLGRFVFPKYREEGPPQFVQNILLGNDFLGEGVKIDPPTRSILEMMTIGYRPVTSLAILQTLIDTPNLALHGMQLGRELEKRFKAKEGWFTQTRYYTDRVGKLLPLLTRLELIQELTRKDSRTGRSFAAYQINPRLKEPVAARLESLSRGESLVFFPSQQTQNTVLSLPKGIEKTCKNCGVVSTSTVARYCEICGDPMQMSCRNCNSTVDAIYDYCVSCGSKIS